MGKYVIKGGNKIDGKIRIESAKNSVLPLLAGAILTDEKVIIKDCPKIKDVLNMIKILNSIGVKTEFCGNDLCVDASSVYGYTLPSILTGELRSSVFMLGALISKTNKAVISYPGGCDIGLRPIDIHIKALKDIGVKIEEIGGELYCTTECVNGREIYLDFPSVGATENIMLASVFCIGETTIKNSAKEPEIVDLMNFLNSMGAEIYGGGTATIVIKGVKKLHGTVFKPMPDRIEAGTYLIAGAITGGNIEISNVKAENISSLLHKLSDNTCKISINNDIIYLKSDGKRKCFNIETNPYPGFPTDLQSQMTTLATVSEGTSVITENIFEMRFKFARELIKMGADVKVFGKTVVVTGVKKLHGANVKAEDLRGGASLVLAGICAEGKTVVQDIKHIERGYLDLEKKLMSLGVDIKKKN